jgi:hypothetical protein
MASVGLREHLHFCQIDGWQELKGARGHSRDHIYFVKELADGRALRTKVSHGTKNREYSAGLWKQIWHEQLALDSEAEFWAVLKEKRPALRAQSESALEQEALPGWLVQRLIYSVGLHEQELASFSLAEAERRWQEYQLGPALSSLETTSAEAAQPELASLGAQPLLLGAGLSEDSRPAVGF